MFGFNLPRQCEDVHAGGMDRNVTDARAVLHTTVQVMDSQHRDTVKDGDIGAAQLAGFPTPHSVIGKQSHDPTERLALSNERLENFPHLS